MERACATTIEEGSGPGAGGSGLFPWGPGWRVEAESAWDWFAHRFGGLPPGGPDRGELPLLVLDLACYEGQVERWLRKQGPRPLPLEEYLRPGREHWGGLALPREEAADA